MLHYYWMMVQICYQQLKYLVNMKQLKYIIAFSLAFFVFACVNDSEELFIEEGEKVVLDYPGNQLEVERIVGDIIEINPKLKFSNEEDTLSYRYEWYEKGVLVNKGRSLSFQSDSIRYYKFNLLAINTITNVSNVAGRITVNAGPKFKQGWVILYNGDANDRLGYIKGMKDDETGAIEYISYKDVFITQNQENLPNNCTKLTLQNYGTYLNVLTTNGMGSKIMKMNGMLQLWELKDVFGGELPTGFKPLNYFCTSKSHWIISGDGKLYYKLKPPTQNDPNLDLVQFRLEPKYIANEGVITDGLMYDMQLGWGELSLYDNKNKSMYFVFGNSAAPVDLRQIPMSGKIPTEYCDVSSMGDYSVRKILTNRFHPMFGSTNYYLILEKDDQYYFQTFSLSKDWFGNIKLKIYESDKRIKFPMQSLITDESKFWKVKQRDYIFFTGGANNDGLYYYDLTRRDNGDDAITLVKLFNGRVITSMFNVGSALALGFEDGLVEVYDISEQALAKKEKEPVFEPVDFGGSIIDIVYHGAKQTQK